MKRFRLNGAVIFAERGEPSHRDVSHRRALPSMALDSGVHTGMMEFWLTRYYKLFAFFVV